MRLSATQRMLSPLANSTARTLAALASCSRRSIEHAFLHPIAIKPPSQSVNRISNRSMGTTDKELFLDILDSTATKRDARSYLNRFGHKKVKKNTAKDTKLIRSHGVNLGDLYNQLQVSTSGPDRTTQLNTVTSEVFPQTIHVSLIKIRGPELLSDEVVLGIGRTLSQLAKLGMVSIVIVSPAGSFHESHVGLDNLCMQACRIVDAILEIGDVRAQYVDQLFDVSSAERCNRDDQSKISQRVLRLANQNMLYGPLRRAVIPVIAPIALDQERSHQNVEVEAGDVARTLVHLLQDNQAQHKCQSRPGDIVIETGQAWRPISFDRMIVLDHLGGTPSADRKHGRHVYINIEQEFDDIDASLEIQGRTLRTPDEARVHAQNLRFLRDTLALLPPSSSGLIATPQEVSGSATQTAEDGTGSRVRTRRPKNPLIYNLLTDKPAISSSLPHDRSSTPSGVSTSTFVKKGMTLSFIPDAKAYPWDHFETADMLSLSDSRIDVTRLVALIEASFRRKLDVEHYLSRLEGKLAGLIVAGDYEGCALCTWESTPEFPDIKVPYLDKFAVMPRSQGTGVGVADIIFQAMVRTCFPRGACWRSRADNPVNKWYFERARGTWKLPGGRWTSFWTTENPSQDELRAYNGVCTSVTQSWAD